MLLKFHLKRAKKKSKGSKFNYREGIRSRDDTDLTDSISASDHLAARHGQGDHTSD
jgi:hypothetical protein